MSEEKIPLVVETEHRDKGSVPGLRNLVQGLSSVATAAFSLFLQFDRLEKLQVNIQQQQASLASQQATLASNQRRYSETVKKFGENSDQAQAALQRLNATEQQISVTQQRLTLAQGDLNQAYLQMALSTGPMAITMFSGLNQALGPGKLLGAIKNVNLAFLTSPIGIVTIAIGALVGVLFTVTDGFRNWKPVIDFVNQALDILIFGRLQLLLDVFGKFVPGVQGAADSLRAWRENGIIPTTISVGELKDATDKVSSEAVPGLDEAIKTQAVPGLNNLTSAVIGARTETESLIARLEEAASKRIAEASAAISAQQGLLGALAFQRTPAFLASPPLEAAGSLLSGMKRVTLAGGGFAYVSEGVQINPTQRGFEGVVTKPTMFLAGEAGAEHVRVMPGGGGASGTVIIKNELIMDGHVLARAVSQISGLRSQTIRGSIF